MKRPPALFSPVLLSLLLMAGIATAQIEAGTPSASVLSRDTLTTALPIFNRSGAEVERIEVPLEGGLTMTVVRMEKSLRSPQALKTPPPQ